MKRSEALTPLSHDHHHALYAAQRLKNATPQNAAAARDEFLAFWHAEGNPHFRAEDELLLPVWARFAPPDHEAVVRVLVEHVRLRAMAHALEADPTTGIEPLHEIGDLLHDHVRFEERVFFPLAEELIPPRELALLGEAFAAAGA